VSVGFPSGVWPRWEHQADVFEVEPEQDRIFVEKGWIVWLVEEWKEMKWFDRDGRPSIRARVKMVENRASDAFYNHFEDRVYECMTPDHFYSRRFSSSAKHVWRFTVLGNEYQGEGSMEWDVNTMKVGFVNDPTFLRSRPHAQLLEMIRETKEMKRKIEELERACKWEPNVEDGGKAE